MEEKSFRVLGSCVRCEDSCFIYHGYEGFGNALKTPSFATRYGPQKIFWAVVSGVLRACTAPKRVWEEPDVGLMMWVGCPVDSGTSLGASGGLEVNCPLEG